MGERFVGGRGGLVYGVGVGVETVSHHFFLEEDEELAAVEAAHTCNGEAVGGEEGLGHGRPVEQHVVVGVDETLGEAGNKVEVMLNDGGVEAGKAFGRHYLRVVDDLDAWVVGVQPCRLLSVGHDEDAPYPRGVAV